ncbi:MAG: pentapeptide repeat-containing protein [Spirulinaceae cyanobacterium SM2_1_0]|nr:pentapeptide repeat-containing protein [Spirulinaceae cyanobacterium SM2_1_0]
MKRFNTIVASVVTATLLLGGVARAEHPHHVVRLLTTNLCAGCDLSGADLSDEHLIGADLRGANLAGADLTGANLEGADLTGANLSGAQFDNAFMTNATLREANLANSDFTGATLIAADLTDAYLDEGTQLAGAELFNTQGIGIGGSEEQWLDDADF